MRQVSVWLVLAWWFAQVRVLQPALALLMRSETAGQVSLIAAALLGAALSWRLKLGRRAGGLPLPAVLAAGACAAWLLVEQWSVPWSYIYVQPVRAYAHWLMSLSVIGATAWLVLKVEPVDEPVVGDGSSPTLRLALGVAVCLMACGSAWWMPWLFDLDLPSLMTWLFRPGRPYEYVARPESIGITLSRWATTVMPFVAGAALVWKGRIGPRILERQPGIMRMSTLLAAWLVGTVFAAILAAQTANTGGQLMPSSHAGASFFTLLFFATMLAPVLPLLLTVLLWSVLHMLLTLGRTPEHGEDRVRPVRRPPANPAAPATPAAVAEAPDASPARAAREIKRLLSERRLADALALYDTVAQAHPGFDPGASAVVPLTKGALRHKTPELAVQLLEAFAARRPGDATTPMFRYLQAQALSATGRWSEAQATLRALLAQHPQDPIAGEARAMLTRGPA